MRAVLRRLPCCLLVACGAAPSQLGEVPISPPPFVLRQWTAVLPAPGSSRCVVVDTASQWREQRSLLGPAARTLSDTWCQFAVERAVVVVVAGPFAPAVAHALHSDEGVDVLVLTVRPDASATAGERGLAHVIAVPARASQLAIVLRAPGADHEVVETTLAVFAGR